MKKTDRHFYLKGYVTLLIALSVFWSVPGQNIKPGSPDKPIQTKLAPPASLPNLRTNYTPPGWNGPIYVWQAGGHTEFYAGVKTLVNVNFYCANLAIPPSETFSFIFQDNSAILDSWMSSGANLNAHHPLPDNLELFFTEGDHELCQTVDFGNLIEETNEDDNQYCETFTFHGPPAAPSVSYPPAGATCMNTSLVLNWNASEHTTSYYVQVDNDPDFSSPSIAGNTENTAQAISGLSSGITYYWRVYASNPAGNSSYSTARSFTTKPLPPDIPNPGSPSEGSSCVSLDANLRWSAAAGTISYNLQVADNEDFNSPVIDETGVTGTSLPAYNIAEGTLYYWRVASVGACEISAGWSEASTFTTLSTPTAPEPVTPADGETCVLGNINFRWNPSIDPASDLLYYSLRIDDNSDFSSPEERIDFEADTAIIIPFLEPGTTYYWYVKSNNGCGMWSPASATYSFEVAANPDGIPELLSPADGAECQGTSLMLNWTPVGGATHYQVMVDKISGSFGSPEINLTDITKTSVEISGLNPDTEYHWLVRGTTECGVHTGWPAPQTFTTAIALETPVLSVPLNNSTNQPLSPTLTWEPVAAAQSYQLRLDDNPDFGSPLYNEEVLSTQREFSGLDNGATYYWQIRANGVCTFSEWSEIRQFDTEGSGTTNTLNSICEYGFELGNNYPNPFDFSTSIAFNIPVSDWVIFEFIDLQGQIIEAVSEYYTAGAHTTEMNLKGKVQPGIYLYRMRTQNYTKTKLCVVR
ncbi:MAG: T9SS type A sorting domain-containing protein [Bacteroidales bacterium]